MSKLKVFPRNPFPKVPWKLTWHHLLPKSRGGRGIKANKVREYGPPHTAYHALFDVRDPYEVTVELNLKYREDYLRTYIAMSRKMYANTKRRERKICKHVEQFNSADFKRQARQFKKNICENVREKKRRERRLEIIEFFFRYGGAHTSEEKARWLTERWIRHDYIIFVVETEQYM